MAISIWKVSITASAAGIRPHSVRAVQAGAIGRFLGSRAGAGRGREITGIEYEAHQPMAEHQMELIAEEARDEFGLTEV